MKVKPTHLTISVIAASAHITSAIPTPNPQNALAGAFYPTFFTPSEASSSPSSSPSSATFAPQALKRLVRTNKRRRDGTAATSENDDEEKSDVDDDETDNVVEVSTTVKSGGNKGDSADSDMSTRVDEHKDDITSEINKGVCEGYTRCMAEAKGGAVCEEPIGGC